MAYVYKNISLQECSSTDVEICVRIAIGTLREDRNFFN